MSSSRVSWLLDEFRLIEETVVVDAAEEGAADVVTAVADVVRDVSELMVAGDGAAAEVEAVKVAAEGAAVAARKVAKLLATSPAAVLSDELVPLAVTPVALAGRMIWGYLCCHSSCHWRNSCCC